MTRNTSGSENDRGEQNTQTDGGESPEGDANPGVEALETAPRAHADVTVPDELLTAAERQADQTGADLDEVLLCHITYTFRDEHGEVLNEL
jgi:hypothetical protein